MTALLTIYIFFTCIVAFVALLGVAMSSPMGDTNHKWSRISAQAFFLSPVWPLAVPLVLIWLGVKAWGPQSEEVVDHE